MDIALPTKAIVVNIGEARRRFDELVDVCLGGGEVVLARRGKPIARLVMLTDQEIEAARKVAHDSVERR